MATEKFLMAKAIIKNEDGEWTENFQVEDGANAKQEVQVVIDYYNQTLKEGDKKRELVQILEVFEHEEELEEVSDEEFDDSDLDSEEEFEDSEDEELDEEDWEAEDEPVLDEDDFDDDTK